MAEGSSTTNGKSRSFVWTDDEVELLLRATLDYKASKLEYNVNWETCQSKYADIMQLFQKRYPQQQTEKDFPHEVTSILKPQITAKLKNIRTKYRQAVDVGRRRGQGRVILIFYELCEQIWGGSPAPRSAGAEDETEELLEEPPGRCSSQPTPPEELEPFESLENLPPVPVKPERELVQAKLDHHKRDRLKRKTGTKQMDPAVQEDLRIKRRMLELMEAASRHSTENIQQINANIATVRKTIQEGFALMRELLLRQAARPHGSSGGGQVLGHPAPRPSTPVQPVLVKEEEEEEEEEEKVFLQEPQ